MSVEDPLSIAQVQQSWQRPAGCAQWNFTSAHTASTIDYSAAEQMSPALDRLSLQFAIWARDRNSAALDIGCGDGVATVAVLARGGHVVAVDPDATAISRLIARIPSEHLRRVKVRVGKLPDLEFKAAHFSALHVARVLHLLDPPALEHALRKFFRWLYPEGKLFISALTPAGPAWRAFRAEFQLRQSARHPWPGYLDEISRYHSQSRTAAFPIHLLDECILSRALIAAGFILEEAETYSPTWPGAQQCCSVIARCGP
ncbi:MAG: polyketide synthase -related protein [Gammaproteobacteria bacterium]|nr:polyketide synthase -related protein [Gammaproteobacteria bacterium]